jgi:hypothetical protein
MSPDLPDLPDLTDLSIRRLATARLRHKRAVLQGRITGAAYAVR